MADKVGNPDNGSVTELQPKSFTLEAVWKMSDAAPWSDCCGSNLDFV